MRKIIGTTDTFAVLTDEQGLNEKVIYSKCEDFLKKKMLKCFPDYETLAMDTSRRRSSRAIVLAVGHKWPEQRGSGEKCF